METATSFDYTSPQEEQENIRYISIPDVPELYSITVGGIEYRNAAYKEHAE